MNKLAIVIPIHKLSLIKTEEKSLRCILQKNNVENIFLVLPEKLKVETQFNNINKIFFNDDYFISQKSYNKLLLSKKFFNTFDSFDHILIYQLDSYLIKKTEDLDEFLNEDFIGSPHINIKKKRFTGILNGGFSIRSTKSSIEVLNSNKFYLTFKSLIPVLRYFSGLNRIQNFMKFFFSIYYIYINEKIFKKKKVYFSQILINYFSDFYNEDIFWSLFSKFLNPTFKVAKFNKAIKFGFDKDPAELFNLSYNQLPLGCHNWWDRKNINFWRNYF